MEAFNRIFLPHFLDSFVKKGLMLSSIPDSKSAKEADLAFKKGLIIALKSGEE